MIGRSDKQIKENFKQYFPPKIVTMIRTEDIETGIVKARVLLLLFKAELLQTTRSSMLSNCLA